MAVIIQVNPSLQAQFGLLLVDKAPIEVFLKYLDYADLFLFKFAMKLFMNTSINKYIIELIEVKKLLYRPIYSL